MRSRCPRLCILTLVSLALGGAIPSFSAEPLKLRPMAPIYAGANGVGLSQPEGVSCSGKNELIVADTGNRRLVVYTIGPESISPTKEIVLTELPRPIRVRTRTTGEILAVDGKLHKIARVTPAGEFAGYVEPAGVSGAVVPRSLEIDASDRLYILDVFSERILVLDKANKLQREISFPEEYGFFSDLTVGTGGTGGTVYAVDSVGRRIYSAGRGDEVLSPLPGTLNEAADFPTCLTIDRSGRLLVGDQNGGSILIVGRDGAFVGRQLNEGWKVGLLRYPSSLCIDEAGLLHVADRGNNRIQTFGVIQ